MTKLKSNMLDDLVRPLRQAITGPAFVVLLSLAGIVSTFGQVVGEEAAAMSSSMQPSIRFRLGEKLTYSVALDHFKNAAHVEMSVISGGTLSGRQAIELSSKVKTLELVSATFFQLDESRSVFASPDTGMPIYLVVTDNLGPLPKETVTSYMTQPASSFDLLTVIHAARQTGGVGTFPFLEKGQFYTAVFQPLGVETVKTEAGSFDTTVSTVQSEYLTSLGIREMRINFATDEYHVPVMFRFKTAKGDVRASLLSIQLPETAEVIVPSTPIPTPIPVAVKPTPEPNVYVNNRPLLPELGFELGEILEYNVTSGGKPIGKISFSARERKQFQSEDSLLLSATVSRADPGALALRLGDSALAQVNPETLAPRWFGINVDSKIVGLNQTVTFDARTGGISVGGDKPVDAPIGTHTIVSLIYAMRSFNLKPSKDPGNPVNDTRVAVFWESKPYVFTLRPSTAQELNINGQSVSAQLISINTGVPQLDALAPKVWLSSESRIPLRFSIGSYQADLVPQPANLLK